MKQNIATITLPAFKDAALELAEEVKGFFLDTHQNELHLADRCLDSCERAIDTCLRLLEEKGLTEEQRDQIWERIKALQDQESLIRREHADSCRDSREKLLMLTAAVLIGVIAITNPQLAKGLAKSAAKGLPGAARLISRL